MPRGSPARWSTTTGGGRSSGTRSAGSAPATGSELVGFVNVAWDGAAHAFVLDTVVTAGARRRGIATRLVGVATEQARSAGCEWLHVDFEDHLRRVLLRRLRVHAHQRGSHRLVGQPAMAERSAAPSTVWWKVSSICSSRRRSKVCGPAVATPRRAVGLDEELGGDSRAVHPRARPGVLVHPRVADQRPARPRGPTDVVRLRPRPEQPPLGHAPRVAVPQAVVPAQQRVEPVAGVVPGAARTRRG